MGKGARIRKRRQHAKARKAQDLSAQEAGGAILDLEDLDGLCRLIEENPEALGDEVAAGFDEQAELVDGFGAHFSRPKPRWFARRAATQTKLGPTSSGRWPTPRT